MILDADAPNLGSMYVMLKDYPERTAASESVAAIGDAIRERCRREVRGAVFSAFGAPPMEGLGTTGGFALIVEDRGDLGTEELQRVGDRIVVRAEKSPGLRGLFNSSRADTPWLDLDIDRTTCEALGVSVADVFDTLLVYLGSYYVNNSNEFGRTWQVNVQADPRFRSEARQIRQLHVRSRQGQMIRLGTLLSAHGTGARSRSSGTTCTPPARSSATPRRAPARGRRSR